MSTKLIQTKDYLLLIDEGAKIKEGSYYLTHLGNIYQETKRPFEEDEDIERFTNRKLYKCILAYYPLSKEAKELDLPLLPNPFEEGVDVEKLACEKYNVKDGIRDYDERYYNTINVAKAEAFIEGYKAAQSDKQFSLEDVIKAIDMARLQGSEPFLCKYSDEEIIQSLSTQKLPKEFIPEYRYYYHSSKEFYSDAGFVECSKEQYESLKVEIPTCPLKAEIKTITNSEGKEELVGTYKY